MTYRGALRLAETGRFTTIGPGLIFAGSQGDALDAAEATRAATAAGSGVGVSLGLKAAGDGL
jgi:hypothetical protein